MKRSKRFLSILLAALVLITSLGLTSMFSTFATGTLSSYYSTNPNSQVGANKTISIDGSISDWDSSMLIAQGTANDDPRVYRPNSMYEVGVDLYALYGAYDDNNLYLMWEMTNVQDVVAPTDDYPLSQGTLWQTQEFPFFIMVDTGKADTAIGNNAALTTGGTIWNSGMTVQNSFNKLISINTKGGNGPWVYGGDSTGLNPVEILDASSSKVDMGYGLGILSQNVYGIDQAYGHYNNRVPGDVCDESAAWVDFNTKGHSSSTKDFFYELSIPYSELGITKADVESNGVGVMLVATMGMSAMDCLPGDPCMTDQADLDDAANSQENNSFEKSDEDFITAPFARIGKLGSGTITPVPTPSTPVETPTTVPDVTPTTAEPSETTASTPADSQPSSTPIIVPPVVTNPTEVTPTESSTAPTAVPVPTLDFDDPSSTAPTETTTAKPSVPVINDGALLGDADLNGTVNIKDATLIQKHLAKITTLEETAQLVSDVDANDIINIRDVTFIQKWLAKMDVEYAIGEPVNTGVIIVPTTTPEAETTNIPVVVPVTTLATEATEPTETPAVTEPSDATVATEPSERPTETQPVITDPIYTDPIYTNPVGGDTITLYYENTNGWGSVYWHGWNEAGGTNTAWPGDLMENVSGNIYKATVDASFTGIIFNDGSNNDANKTTNLTIPGDGQIYRNGSWSAYDPNNGGGGNDNPVVNPGGTISIYVENTNGWGSVYWHGWNSAGGTNTAWPGDPMENVGGNIYKATVDASFTGIVFNDNNGTQTDDLTIPGDNQIYNLATGSWSAYTGGGSSGGNSDNNNGGNTGGEGDYIYFTDNAGWGTVYCHTWNLSGSTNTPWPGDQMENIGDNQYRLLVDGSHTHLKFNGGNGGPESNEFELVLGNTYSN